MARLAALAAAALLCACRAKAPDELPALADAPALARAERADVPDYSPAYGVVTGRPGALLVDVNVEADDAARVRAGEAASATVLPSTRAVACRVARVLPAASAETGQSLAWLKPDSEAGLSPNDFVYARITMGVKRGVLTVPSAAVLVSGGRTVVIRAAAGKEARYDVVPVKTGAEAAGRVEVLAGLAPGDQVVLQGGLGTAFPDFKAAGD